MSVINKVLRDLDQRGAAPDAPGEGAQATLRAGTHSVTTPPRPSKARRRPGAGIMVLVVLLLGGAGGGIWWMTRGGESIVPPAVSPVEAPVAQAPASGVVPVPSVEAPPPSTEAPRTDAVGLPVFRMESQLNLKDWKPAPVETPVAAPALTPAPAVMASATKPAPVVADTASVAQRQQQAGRDALAQAQNLWNSGGQDAAVDLLQEAMQAAERNLAASPTTVNTQLLASLVREWARMLLAQGRPGPVWETLTRLEPQLRGEADLWGQRGNAAQRLGRHQDSVHAYMSALQFRPNEQRWLLGTAVSLAALGQTAAAAEMAEKARAVGSISPEVQAYLRQVGVPFKDK